MVTTMRERRNVVSLLVIFSDGVVGRELDRIPTDSAIRQPLDGTLRLRPRNQSVSRIGRAFSPDHSTSAVITAGWKSWSAFEQPVKGFYSCSEIGDFFRGE